MADQIWTLKDSTFIQNVKPLEKLLDDRKASINSVMSFSAGFNATLIKHEVITKAELRKIMQAGPDDEKASVLYDKLLTVGQLRGLLYTFADTKQNFIIENMGFKPAEFQEGAPTRINAAQCQDTVETGASGGQGSVRAAQAAGGANSASSKAEDIDEIIDRYGKLFIKAFKGKLPEVSSKIQYDLLKVYLGTWNILTQQQRQHIEHEMKTSQARIEHICNCLENRDEVEGVLFAKALKKSDQTHWLKKILPNREDVKAILDIDLEQCIRRRNEDL